MIWSSPSRHRKNINVTLSTSSPYSWSNIYHGNAMPTFIWEKFCSPLLMTICQVGPPCWDIGCVIAVAGEMCLHFMVSGETLWSAELSVTWVNRLLVLPLSRTCKSGRPLRGRSSKNTDISHLFTNEKKTFPHSINKLPTKHLPTIENNIIQFLLH